MKTVTSSAIVSFVAAALLALPFVAYADLEIQNAQWQADKNNLHVKGRLTADGVSKVYVLNAKTNRQIGTINTYSKGQQFNGDLSITDARAIPCSIRVQTNAPSAFGRVFGGGGGGGEFSISAVAQAPESCAP